VAGNVDDVVDATGDPVVAVFVAARAVAGEVVARIRREVGLHEPLVIAIDRPHLTWPAIFDHELPLVAPSKFGTLVVDQCRLDAEERPVAEPGFSGPSRPAAA
jgi:hypothetical protein